MSDSGMTNTKIGAFVVGGIFIALASLTASLPLNLPSHQAYNTAATFALNNGDTAWIIVATIFGLFLGPALAHYYGHIHGHNTEELVKQVTIIGALITFLWVIFSFSLAYGKDANGDQIMGYPLTYYMFRDVGAAPEPTVGAPTIPLSIFAIFELGFAIVTPVIVTVSVAGRVNTLGWLFFLFVWHLVIYCPIAHIVWTRRGWFPNHDIEDFSGGIVVHMLASVTSLAAHIFINKGLVVPKTKPATDNNTILTGTFIVWFLWFAFNSGKAHNAGPVAAQSIVNTIAATTAGVLTWWLYDLVFDRTTTPATLSSAVLLSLVAITPASGFVTVGGAFCIAIATVLITYPIATHVLGEASQPNEPISVLSIHGIGGTLGFFFTALISYKFINQWGLNGLTYGRGIPLAHHISAILAIWSCGLIAVFLVLFLTNLVAPISNEEGAEAAAPASKAPPVQAQPQDADEAAKSGEVVEVNSV